jgi:hypothetical protein
MHERLMAPDKSPPTLFFKEGSLPLCKRGIEGDLPTRSSVQFFWEISNGNQAEIVCRLRRL